MSDKLKHCEAANRVIKAENDDFREWLTTCQVQKQELLEQRDALLALCEAAELVVETLISLDATPRPVPDYLRELLNQLQFTIAKAKRGNNE